MSDGISIEIASTGIGTSWEVRVRGPGGWRTSLSQASLSACQHDAWARVLNAPVDDHSGGIKEVQSSDFD